MKCAKCNTTDNLHGETGKVIRYRKTKFPEFRNKIVCYPCWELLVYGESAQAKRERLSAIHGEPS